MRKKNTYYIFFSFFENMSHHISFLETAGFLLYTWYKLNLLPGKPFLSLYTLIYICFHKSNMHFWKKSDYMACVVEFNCVEISNEHVQSHILCKVMSITNPIITPEPCQKAGIFFCCNNINTSNNFPFIFLFFICLVTSSNINAIINILHGLCDWIIMFKYIPIMHILSKVMSITRHNVHSFAMHKLESCYKNMSHRSHF